jgi:hypothetical protein
MKIVEVITREGHIEAVRILISPRYRQQLLDVLQARLAGSEDSHILVYPLEIALPRSDDDDDVSGKQSATTTREELYHEIPQGSTAERHLSAAGHPIHHRCHHRPA